MNMPDPSFLPALKVVKESRTFEDATRYRNPDGTPMQWNITFEAQEGFPHSLLVREKVYLLTNQYGPEGFNKVRMPDGEIKDEPRPAGIKKVETGDGQIIPISESLCDQIALLLIMDKSDVGHLARRYDFERWAILSERATDIYQRIYSFAEEIRDKAYADDAIDKNTGGMTLGNESAATEGNTSEPQQAKEDATQTS